MRYYLIGLSYHEATKAWPNVSVRQILGGRQHQPCTQSPAAVPHTRSSALRPTTNFPNILAVPTRISPVSLLTTTPPLLFSNPVPLTQGIMPNTPGLRATRTRSASSTTRVQRRRKSSKASTTTVRSPHLQPFGAWVAFEATGRAGATGEATGERGERVSFFPVHHRDGMGWDGMGWDG
jgi:hypothetical protein